MIEEKVLKLDKSNWVPTKLGDLAREISKRVDNPSDSEYDRFVSLRCFVSGDIKIKSWETTETLVSSAKAFQKGDILFARRNAYLRRASMVDFDGCCSGDAFVLREDHDKVVPGFLAFLLNSDVLWDYANSNAAGTMSKRVKWRDLSEYEFLLPPKDQQAKLAELLWAMDEVIERENEFLERLVITKKVISKANIDFGYSSKGKPLPVDWKMMKVENLAKVQAGSTPLRSNNDFFNGGSFSWVKTLDLNNDKIYSTEESITQLALDKTSCKLREKGSVLVAMYGGFNQIGRTGLLEIEAATNQAISAIMVDRKVILPEFLLLVLNSRVDYWKKVAISSRKDPNITKVDVEKFPLSIPSINKQQSILKKTNSILLAIEESKSKISSSKALQKSLINQVF